MKTLNLLLCLFLGLSLQAQQHPQNVPPANGQLISEPEYGVSLNLPQGWMAQEYDGGYLLQKQGEDGVILLGAHEANSIQELKTEASTGIYEDGLAIAPVGTPAPYLNKGVMVFLKGTFQGQPAEGYAMGILSPNGGGLLIVALQQGQMSPSLPQTAHAIANSFKAKKIDKSSEVQEWTDYFTAARLTYMDSYSSNTPGGGGYSVKKNLDLCSDGSYRYFGSDFTTFGDYGGYVGGDNYASGTWKVISRGPEVLLMIYPNSGGERSFTLTYPDNKTHLNGERWFVTHASDGPDYAPSCN
ncbi:MAG: hypothetical protein AAFV80_01415 [Bacteroidota bacterium]